MRVTRAQAAAWTGKKPKGPPKPRRGVMNGEEADFARILSLDPTFRRVLFEKVTFNLGGGAKFTPDFVAFRHDGSLVVFEVKGFRRTAAIVRLKVASGMFPEIPMYLQEFDRKTGWTGKRIQP